MLGLQHVGSLLGRDGQRQREDRYTVGFAAGDAAKGLMVGGVALGWAGVDDQIDELTALGGDRLGGLGAKSLVLVGGQRLFGEDVDDDAGRGGFHGRTMHRGHRAIKQARPSLCPARQVRPGNQRALRLRVGLPFFAAALVPLLAALVRLAAGLLALGRVVVFLALLVPSDALAAFLPFRRLASFTSTSVYLISHFFVFALFHRTFCSSSPAFSVFFRAMGVTPRMGHWLFPSLGPAYPAWPANRQKQRAVVDCGALVLCPTSDRLGCAIESVSR